MEGASRSILIDLSIGRLFQRLYRDSDENTRRAMNKSMVSVSVAASASLPVSFQYESGGTCLNMNWEEVSKGRVACEPPEVNDLSVLKLLIIGDVRLGNGMEEVQLVKRLCWSARWFLHVLDGSGSLNSHLCSVLYDS